MPASRTSSAGQRTSTGQSALISNRDRLLRIFGEHTQTDHNLHTVDGLINLFNLVAFIGRTHDQADPLPRVCCHRANRRVS